MDKKRTIQVVIAVAAVFACGVLYIVFGRGASAGTGVKEVISAEGQEGSTGQTTEQADGENGDITDGQINNETTADSGEASSEGSANTTSEIYIYICGAVKKEGVYKFDTTPRAVEVVERAGGFTKKADTKAVNLAEKLEDGAQLIIPTKSETKNVKESGGQSTESQTSGNSGASDDGKININTADMSELTKIPGIGEAKATAIISYREQNGSFSKPEDIMNISGIKSGTYEKLKDYIKV